MSRTSCGALAIHSVAPASATGAESDPHRLQVAKSEMNKKGDVRKVASFLFGFWMLETEDGDIGCPLGGQMETEVEGCLPLESGGFEAQIQGLFCTFPHLP